MPLLRWFILYLFCWQLFGPVVAQTTVASRLPMNYVMRNLDNTNGLADNFVYTLTQDRKGYIWIGTTKGLQRYDGLRFMDCYNTGNTRGEIEVADLFADDTKDRILYRQADNSIYQWDRLRNSAQPVIVENTPSSLTPTHYLDEKKESWTFQEYWVNDKARWKEGKDGLVWMTVTGKTISGWGHFLNDDQHNQVWGLFPIIGLGLIDRESKQIYSIAYNPINNPLLTSLQSASASIRKIYGDSHGNIWLMSWSHQFYRYDTHTKIVYTYSVADIQEKEGSRKSMPAWVSDMLEDDHGVLWLTTANAGLLQYDFAKNDFQYLTSQSDNTQGLQYNYEINCIIQDKDENLWIATDKGINVFNPYRQYFTRLIGQEKPLPTLAGPEIDAVLQTAHKDLWVGSWGGGINVYDSAFHLKKHFFFEGEYKYEKNMVWDFLEQDDGTVWAGCQIGLLHCIDPSNGTVTTLHPPELRSTIKCMTKDHTGNTLLGLHSGKIVIWDKQTHQFLSYDSQAQPSSLTLASIESLYVDREGHCWAATYNGVGEFDMQKRCFIAFYKPPQLNTMRCHGITACNDSTLAIGTENNGLFFLNKRTHLFSKPPLNEEQLNWSAYAVATDNRGHIWFTTAYSVGDYDPVTQKCLVCRPEKGIVNDRFRSFSFLTMAADRWLTWTQTEVVSFDPQAIAAAQNKSAPVTITGFRVFSSPVLIDSFVNEKKALRLSYKENFLNIQFSNLKFSGIEQTKYYYKLEGVDKDWVYGGARGSAGYTNLPPGKYVFKVKTENTADDRDAASLKIIIAAPFWATIWFRMGCLLAIIALTLLLVRWYNRNLRQEAKMKQQIAETEMMALRAQMNPHFIFNCINSIDALIQCDDKYLATVYLNKFARLIRNILDSSKQHTISLARDLETLQLYIDLEQFRNENKFTTEMKIDETLLDEDCKVPPLIIQPYVENAILHGLRNRQDNNGKLSIEVHQKEDHLVYRIEDNGIGRAAAAKHRSSHHSYGMEMSRDRVDLFNGEQKIPVVITDLEENGQSAGTRVEVSLKIV